MAKRMTETTPKADGFRMPAEFEPQAGVWMLWPERPDNWRGGGKPAQRAFCAVAEAIARFEPVTMCVSAAQYQNARARLPEHIRVVEMSANDAWVRDCEIGRRLDARGEGGFGEHLRHVVVQPARVRREQQRLVLQIHRVSSLETARLIISILQKRTGRVKCLRAIKQ